MNDSTFRNVLAAGGIALVLVLLILGWRIVAVSVGPVKVELEAPDDPGASDSGGRGAGSPVSISGLALCVRQDYDGSRCKSNSTAFPSGTDAVYATWQSEDALGGQAVFTRRWIKDGETLLEHSNAAGENARWTSLDGCSYFVYLSATEGTGKSLFDSSSLPAGRYRFELYVNGQFANAIDFEIQ